MAVPYYTKALVDRWRLIESNAVTVQILLNPCAGA